MRTKVSKVEFLTSTEVQRLGGYLVIIYVSRGYLSHYSVDIRTGVTIQVQGLLYERVGMGNGYASG